MCRCNAMIVAHGSASVRRTGRVNTTFTGASSQLRLLSPRELQSQLLHGQCSLVNVIALQMWRSSLDKFPHERDVVCRTSVDNQVRTCKALY